MKNKLEDFDFLRITNESDFKPKFDGVHFGKWVVDKDGWMCYDNYYLIHCKDLQDNWIEHLYKKAWIDFNTFIPAYIQALKNAKHTHINVKLY